MWHLEKMDLDKKTTFEKVTMFVVILMVLVTVGGLIASALSVLM